MNNTQKIIAGVVVAGGITAGVFGLNNTSAQGNQIINLVDENKNKITLNIPVDPTTSSIVVTPSEVTTTTITDVDLYLANKLRSYFVYKGMTTPENPTNANLDRVVQAFTDAGTTPEAFINDYKITQ